MTWPCFEPLTTGLEADAITTGLSMWYMSYRRQRQRKKTVVSQVKGHKPAYSCGHLVGIY